MADVLVLKCTSMNDEVRVARVAVGIGSRAGVSVNKRDMNVILGFELWDVF